MQGSTIINCRQHVGLQKLLALAGVTHSFLGPVKKHKFIQDDTSGESTLVSCCVRVFENLELTCAVGQLVHETIQAHHKVYHTGSGCLLFLAGAWSRAALECLHRGISVTNIVSAMSEGLEICLGVCRRSSISTERLGVQQSEARRPSCLLQGTTKAGLKTSRLSRHFCGAKSEIVSTEQPKHPDIAHIAEGLSHGCLDAMTLVVEAIRMQSKNNKQDVSSSSFDIAKVLTCVLPGLPEDHACVVLGCIVHVCAEQAVVARHLQGQQLRVALIDGDLKDNFRHLGFNRPKGLARVGELSVLPSSSKEEEWMEKVVTRLLELEVNLLLVSGLVGEKMMLRGCRHQILVVERVKDSVLKITSNATGAVPVTYAAQLSKYCVGTGVNVAIWRELSRHDGTPLTTVNISTGNSELVTAVLTSCVYGKLQGLEDRFWTCAYRLHHALKDGAVLPGTGVTEMVCVHHLQKQAEHDVKHPTEKNKGSIQSAKAGTALNPFRGLVLHLMADALIDYSATIMVNTGRFSKVGARTALSQHLKDCNSLDVASKFLQFFSEGEQNTSSQMKSSGSPSSHVYDCLNVKQEVWRKALDLVFLILQADAEIITGIDQKPSGEQDFMQL